MPIEMPKGLPFSVDTWSPCSRRKRHHFLTHAHRDHAQGIVANACYPVYSTLLSRTLILQYYPQLDESIFVCIEVGQSLVIEDEDGDFSVTVFDANHCPGAVMFLFEGKFGNILHTGDCRLTPECLQSLPDKYRGKKGKEPRCPLDCIFLDCTFGQFHSEMPSKHLAKRQVINCIWKHPDACTVYLTCDMLGQEEILVEVSQTFGEKIYVDEAKNLECSKFLELIAPDIVSKDPSSRFQLLDGFPRLYERAEAMISSARTNFQQEPLIIRPSSQWYACGEGSSEMGRQRKERFDQAVRDFYGVWHVCYSIHSSRDELEWALQLLAPKWVVSTTPNCRAMELSYVKKHCFNSKRVISDSLWKLLDISAVTSMGPEESVKSLSSTDVDASILDSYVETQIKPVVISAHQSKRLSLSPPSKRPAITLFGRARLGPHDSTIKYEPNKVLMHNSFMEKSSVETEDVCLPKEDDTEGKFDELLETKRRVDFEEIECSSKTVVHTETSKPPNVSPISIANCYNENLRRVYRSMNVPVPQRLPSLVKLMETRRHLKNRMHN